ncbi:polyketide cyclase / dehydrase and lipid transport family protein [Asticcacaulis biprosthecium C19]|uniref:Polyketide cyclase / dehydrase and lipid transport family protein n=1 Tax=Asticcacaulis biprosthecium C19 TaxID=715226 RepID=F4QKY7_9CAUL|nr:SRPBCC family protein [Asticcacaulis biprosthecium]EGF92210.1 polyketide cyclase / dehydrase and lipid transport family protein [Asticcacaulis biprosthecium C19]
MGMILLILVGAVIAAVLIVAATKPNVSQIQRSATINAPAETILAHIQDFRKWRAWSPWEALDPELNRTYSGQDSGIGAIYDWRGKGKAGAGRMEIVEQSASKITIKLDFIKPFQAKNIAEFTLQPQGDTQVVTWTMTGPQPFPIKVMGTLFNMDDLVGKDFEAGLNNLKTLSEDPETAKLVDQESAAS